MESWVSLGTTTMSKQCAHEWTAKSRLIGQLERSGCGRRTQDLSASSHNADYWATE